MSARRAEVLGGASSEEAAAAIAAVEAFEADLAPATAMAPLEGAASAWLLAARREAVGREPAVTGSWR